MKIIPPDCHSCPSRKHSIFNFCTITELETINCHKSCGFYTKGQTLFNEGSRPNGLFSLYSGKMKIVKDNSDGKEQIIRLVKPGDTLGYRALIAGTSYSATAIALEDSVVCSFSREYFDQILLSNAKVGNELIKLLSVTLGDAEERMAKMSLKPVRERLAEALILLNKTYNIDEKPNFSISISREDLANIVGTAKETAIRFLSEFKADKIISTQKSIIKILDLNKLVQISHLYD